MTHGNGHGILPVAIGLVFTMASLKIVSDAVKDVSKTKTKKKKGSSKKRVNFSASFENRSMAMPK